MGESRAHFIIYDNSPETLETTSVPEKRTPHLQQFGLIHALQMFVRTNLMLWSPACYAP
jgi:hypothetical protein